MARAIRAVSSERGRDPRKFTLLVFGGAGSLHGVAVAKELGIKQIIVAPYGGVFSAFGFLCADIERYYVQAFSRIWDDSMLREMNHTFEVMTEKALVSSQKWGYKKTSVQIERYVDLRYIQQGSELSIPLSQQDLTHAQLPVLAEAFGREHKKTFGHNFPGMPLEVVNLRVVAKINVAKPTLPKVVETKASFKSNAMKMRKAYFGANYGFIDTPVLQDSELETRPLGGPLLIDRYDTTIVVPPHCEISSADWGSLIINIKE
jgi:N-methylhydantoinase A